MKLDKLDNFSKLKIRGIQHGHINIPANDILYLKTDYPIYGYESFTFVSTETFNDLLYEVSVFNYDTNGINLKNANTDYGISRIYMIIFWE